MSAIKSEAVKHGAGLSSQQERFAVLVAGGTMSQSEAYRETYPASRKWKPSAVHVEACELAANTKVAQRIQALCRIAAEKASLNAAEILREVRRIALSDIGELMHADGRVKLPNELDPATRATIKKFKIDELGRIEYDFWDKNNALEKAMRHLGQYEKDHTQATVGLAALRDALVGAVVGPDPRAALPDDDEPSEDE